MRVLERLGGSVHARTRLPGCVQWRRNEEPLAQASRATRLGCGVSRAWPSDRSAAPHLRASSRCLAEPLSPNADRSPGSSGMNDKLQIAFFGSSLVSAYWNGAATYYRGIIRALAARGHNVTFYEPDIYERQKHRDIEFPSWARVVVYPAQNESAICQLLEEASGADLLIKASGVGAFDELLESAAVQMKSPRTRVVFSDVDA